MKKAHEFEILVACEESQAVCKAFRTRGFTAYSCDTQDCSGGHPEWHLKMDVFEAIKLKKWDAGIFFPPCTYLTLSANKWYKDQPKRKSGALVGEERRKARLEAINFFMNLYDCEIPKIAIENPIGVMSTVFRKPDQIIQPWQFGHGETKATCLWLKGLPNILPTDIIEPIIIKHKNGKTDSLTHFMTRNLCRVERSELRSKTFPGIASAMAEQWGDFLLNNQ